MTAAAPRTRRTAARNAGWILSGAFAVALFLPLIGSVVPLEPAPATTEKRRMAPAPRMAATREALASFPTDFETYYRDGFGFRNALIRLHSLARFHLLGAGSDFVLRGKNGWLYLTDKTGELIGQHRGIDPLTPEHLARWQRYLDDRRAWFDARGIVYLMAIAPSKMTIYPEHLPDWVNVTVGDTPMDQLTGYLTGTAAETFLDLRPVLRQERGRHRVYDRTDTHWNDVGAYAAYREIHRHLVRRLPDLPALDPAELVPGQDPAFSGGLAGMLNLKDVLTERQPTLTPGPARLAREIPLDIELAPDLRAKTGPVTLWSTDRPGPVAIVFGDSFLGQLMPFVETAFSKTYYVPTRPLRRSLIEAVRPDVVLHEITERNTRYPTQDGWPGE